MDRSSLARSGAQEHAGIGFINNWPPKGEQLVVDSPAEAGLALARLRTLGPSSNLNTFVDKDGYLTYTGGAMWGDLSEMTNGAPELNVITVDTRSQYTPGSPSVGLGINAPSDAECDMGMKAETLDKVFGDTGPLLLICSSKTAREVPTYSPLCVCARASCPL